MLKAIQWWRGYSVDITAGLGLLLPLVYLVIATIPALVAVILIVRARRDGASRKHRWGLASIALLMLALQWAVPPLAMAGFQARMSQFGEAEYLALADAMKSTAGPRPRGDLLSNSAVATTLADVHPILRVAPVRPKAYIHSEGVQIRWGSGLTGAFAVDIWNGETEPPVSADTTEPRPLYRHVRLVWAF